MTLFYELIQSWPTSCIKQLWVDTGCSQEDLPEAKGHRDRWRERVKGIRAISMTWLWWFLDGIILKDLRNFQRDKRVKNIFLLSSGWRKGIISFPRKRLISLIQIWHFLINSERKEIYMIFGPQMLPFSSKHSVTSKKFPLFIQIIFFFFLTNSKWFSWRWNGYRRRE